LVILPFDATVLILELVVLTVVLVALPGQPAKPKTAKLNKIVIENFFILAPY
jgi:hypothetical protein